MKFDVDQATAARSLRPYAITAVVAAIAAIGGVAVGGVAGWTLKPSETVEVPRELTDAEVQALVTPQVEEVNRQLGEAQDRVAVLEDEVKTKEARVQELESEMARRSVRGSELRQELEAAKAELADVKAQLAQAIAEKEQLAVELQTTVAKLEEQTEKTKVAEADALEQRWRGFVRQAQLDVCDKGNRKKLGNCRETLATLFDADMQAKYTHCVKAGQEAPSLHEAEKDQDLPEFAQYLDQDQRVTRDWYVLLCDPTLPEAGDPSRVAANGS